MALYINRQAPQSGISSLLAQRGRMGDTELVHMTKPEVKRLQQTGLLSLNPQTGLPEYFLGDIFKGIKNSVKNLLKPENLVPTIASIALPAFGGSFLQNMGLSELASTSILGGAGTFLGNLPFRSLEDSATAGLLSGGTRYGMGKIGQMMGPSDPEVRKLSAGKELGEKKFRANQLKLADAQKDYLFDAGFGEEANLEDFGGDYGELLYGDQYMPDIPKVPGLPNVTTKVDYPDGVDSFNELLPYQENNLSQLAPRAGTLDRQNPGRFTGGAREFGEKGFTKSDFKPVATVTPDELAKEYSRVLKGADKVFFEGSLTDDQKNMIARGYADANNKLLDPSAMRQASDPYRNTRNIVADKGGLNALTDIEFYKSLPVSDILASGSAGLNATLDIGQQALLREEEEKFLAEQAKQGVPAPIARRKYKRLRSRAAPLSTAQTLAAATRGGGLGGASGFYGPTQYAPVRTAEAGGLVALGHGGRPDFEGMVEGDGHGMEDNVIMDIKQKGGLLAVSPKEYVVPADVMSMLGNGNPDDGANEMDKFFP